MRLLFILFGISICTTLFAQDTSDASQLRSMEYMRFANRIKCNSQAGSTLDMRICLNLEFQKEDSVLNATFVMKLIPLSDSLQTVLKQEQASWVLERRSLSKEAAEGFSGHVLGIFYLQSMIDITRKRIEALSQSE